MEVCEHSNETRSECCNAEIATESYVDYPMSSNPFSQDYVVQHLEREVCEECREEM